MKKKVDKFSDRQLRNLKPQTKRYLVWGPRSLSIVVSPTGTKTWTFCYRVPATGKLRWLTLGQYPYVSLDDAEEAHRQALANLKRGTDPREAALAEKRKEWAAETVGDLAKHYLERYASKKKSFADQRRILEKDVLPILGEHKAKDIQRRDVIALLDGIVDRGAPTLANRTLAVIRRMYSWGLSRDLVTSSPCVSVPRPTPENRRDRVLTDDEIGTLWRHLDAEPRGDSVRLALRLILATAQRPGEVMRARWEEIDLKGNWWTIPAERSKNGLPHRVPLSKVARGIVLEAKKTSWAAGWIFPSPRKPQPGEPPAPLERCVLAHWARRQTERPTRKGKRQPSRIPVEPFTPHDLRRTAATQMATLGVERITLSKLLNHSEGGSVTAVYDRATYDSSKKEALDRWSRKLERLTHEAKKGVA